ncbi:hypothetical protein F2Q69_00037124 [Brassica cretica]|uniref:Uncharacterized protein n=1 Tax=Brassica cretica TaxID=69181 RepID=A0A8S9SM60_BRACR|nr:hypothetical protein F2Q69_00037124 [Brassica cretica]
MANYQFLDLATPIPYLSFENHLQTNRAFFVRDRFPVGAPTRRHENDIAHLKYEDKCLRGFVVQGTLCPYEADVREARRIIDRVGWSYTVLHVHPFFPRVVRELISNLYHTADGVLIRGTHFGFDPDVFNTVMLTPLIECFEWTGFTLTTLGAPYQILYRVRERNWLPGPDTDTTRCTG